MKEVGIVHSLNKHNKAVVRFDRKLACEKCNMCFKPKDKMFVELYLDNTLSAKVDDKVEVEIPDNIVLTASFLVYMLPAIFLLVSLFLTRSLNDALSFSISIGAMILSYFFLSFIDKMMKKKKGYLPIMKSIIITEDQNE